MTNNFLYPRPTSWEDFEDMVADIYKREYSQPNLQRYGRSGQKQHGIDIIGYNFNHNLIAIQCKNHGEKNIKQSDIENELKKVDEYPLKINKFIIATTSPRDTSTHQYILELSCKRISEGMSEVNIVFWEDIIDKISNYPDLLYKHITKHFPIGYRENITWDPKNFNCKRTLIYPASSEDIKSVICENVGIDTIDSSYEVSISLSSFSYQNFNNIVDLEIKLVNFLEEFAKPEENLKIISNLLVDLRSQLSQMKLSNTIWVYPNVRLSIAFLFGYIFSKVAGFNLYLISNNNIWSTTNDLSAIPTKVDELLPKIFNVGSKDVFVCLNISRDITTSVLEMIEQLEVEEKPNTLVILNLEGFKVESAAHALSIAKMIARKLKYLSDQKISSLHLFAALPASLAVLITYHLNAIVPIHLYHMDDEHQRYIYSGRLNKKGL